MNKQGKGKIDWCDATWNPITGCLQGCPYCYARKIYERFKKPFVPTFHHSRLSQPLKEKKPTRIFVCSVSDFWGKGVNKEWRTEVYKIMEQTPQHTYLLLTKQPQNIRKREKIPMNAMVGVTYNVFNDRVRIYNLFTRSLRNKTFVSCEPLLEGSVSDYIYLCDWVIVGGNSNKGAEKPKDEWLDEIVEDCKRLKKPLFVKDNYKYHTKIKEIYK